MSIRYVFLISIQEPSKTMENPSLWAFDRILVQDSSHFQAAQHQGVQTTWILRYLISSYFPKNWWFQPIPKRSSPDTSVELWDFQVEKNLQVLSPSFGPWRASGSRPRWQPRSLRPGSRRSKLGS